MTEGFLYCLDDVIGMVFKWDLDRELFLLGVGNSFDFPVLFSNIYSYSGGFLYGAFGDLIIVLDLLGIELRANGDLEKLSALVLLCD